MGNFSKYLSITLLCCITQIINCSVAQQIGAAGQDARFGSNNAIARAVAVNDDDDDNQDTFNLERLFDASAALSQQANINNNDDADTTLDTTTTDSDRVISFAEIVSDLAAQIPDPEIIRPFTAHNANIHTRDAAEYTLLHRAAALDKASSVRQLLIAGTDVDTKNCSGKTPLISAVRNNNEVITKLLIDAKANLELTDNDGDTALFNACHPSVSTNIVLMLLKAGASVRRSSFTGATSKNCEHVLRAFILAGVDVNSHNLNGESLLYCAVNNNNLQAVQILLDAKANVKIRNLKNGKQPLHCAAQNGYLEILNLLLSQDNIDIDAQDFDNQTALHDAASNNCPAIVEALIAAGASQNLQNRYTQTALDIAKNKGYKNIIALFANNAAGSGAVAA